jgi:Zn-dependent M28 family amino/carboxypeptidase
MIQLTTSTTIVAQVDAVAIAAMDDVNPNHIKADMNYLADDLLEGREPGTRGFALASKYVESAFMSMGLLPGVNGASYRQPVSLVKGTVDQAGCGVTLVGEKGKNDLQYDVDFIVLPNLLHPVSEVSAPLVFVGFGIHAPELGYDDYKKIDVKDKIVVYFNQAPESFPSNERAYYSSSATKYGEAAARGAIGVISMQLPGNQRIAWDATVRRSRQGITRWANEAGVVQNTFESLKVITVFNPEHAEKLLANSARNLDEIVGHLKRATTQSFDLNVNATMKVKTTMTAVMSSNLIGVIPGSDPVLKDEYVIYAAHLDHFGFGVPVDGDSIYNGAHDNASGTSILLEIARTFKGMASPTRRSIIFAVVTGEESGLLGSDLFANNPTVSRDAMVANFSIDMPFFFHPVLDIVPYGAQHSSLAQPLAVAAKYLNLGIGPDPFPEQVVFIRSDHYSFIKKGIPALFIKSGFGTVADDKVDRSVADVAWRRTTYHTPQDDMTQAFNFDGAATHVKINFLTGYLVANETARPTWNRGDFFGGMFGSK